MSESDNNFDLELDASGSEFDSVDDVSPKARELEGGRQKVEAKLEELRLNRIEQDYDFV